MLKTAKLAPADTTILRDSGCRINDTGWEEKGQLRKVSQDPTPRQLYEVQARLRSPQVPLRSVVYRDPGGGSPGVEGDLHGYSYLERITWRGKISLLSPIPFILSLHAPGATLAPAHYWGSKIYASVRMCMCRCYAGRTHHYPQLSFHFRACVGPPGAR